MKKHILIVDDDKSIATFLADDLMDADPDYMVEVVHSAEAALGSAAGKRIDLLITDLRLPGLSGLELVRRMRQASPHTRSILITAYGSPLVAAEVERLGIYCYMTKPFKNSLLVQAARDALGLNSAARASCEAG